MPPELSDQYHRARRQFALFSALLLVWALVGVKVEKKPFPQVDIELLNPEMVPLILATLVIYFWYRTLVEWFQCNEERRKARPSRVDVAVANVLGMVALVVPIAQRALKFRFGDIWAQPTLASYALLISSALLILLATGSWIVARRYPPGTPSMFVADESLLIANAVLSACLVMANLVLIWFQPSLFSTRSIFGLAVTLAVPAFWFWYWSVRPRLNRG